MIKDYFFIALKNLRHRKLRSWLTILGIIISVASIVALISISNGLQFAIKEQFEKIGANRIYIMPSGQPGVGEGLTEKDVDVLERITDIDEVIPALVEMSTKIEYGREEIYKSVIGWPIEKKSLWEDYDLEFIEGGPPKKGQKYAVVLGYLAAKDAFDKGIGVRNKVLIKDKKFEVVGVLSEVGNSQDDNQFYILVDTFRDLFEKPDEVSFVEVIIKPGKDMVTVSDKITRELEKSRDDENFQVLTPEQILKFLSTTLGIVQGILVSIAAISLIVGAVGIMNSMYTSVLERTKEIGIMKSIGARNHDILLFFLVEAGLIGVVGGLMGVILGTLIGFGVGAAAAQAGFSLLKIRIEPYVILGGLLFAFLIGMLSGALPAKQAAKLHPVDALRWNQ